MMNSIRIILGLQGKSGSIIIDCACFALFRCDKVARIELYAGQCGIYLHHSAALRSFRSRNMFQAAIPVINAEIMIIATCQL